VEHYREGCRRSALWAGEEAEFLDTSSLTGKDDVHGAQFGDLVNGQIVNAPNVPRIVASPGKHGRLLPEPCCDGRCVSMSCVQESHAGAWLTSTGVLSRHQTPPRGELPSVPKSTPITHGGGCRRHRPDSSDALFSAHNVFKYFSTTYLDKGANWITAPLGATLK
jgi:hypothetical protein